MGLVSSLHPLGVSKGTEPTPPPYTPPYKTALDYLESTGTQYINTGWIPDVRYDEVEIMHHNVSNSASQGVFGVRDAIKVKSFIVLQTSARYYQCALGTATGDSDAYNTSAYSIPKAPVVLNVSCGDATIYNYFCCCSPETSFNINVYNFASPTKPAYLFCLNQNNAKASLTGTSRIYYFKVWRSGILIHHFIPVLDNNDVPCMYDAVTGEFKYNAGTGKFNYKVAPYTRRIAEIECNNPTQYIDMGTNFYNDGSLLVGISKEGGGTIPPFYGYYVSSSNNAYIQTRGANAQFVLNGSTYSTRITLDTHTTIGYYGTTSIQESVNWRSVGSDAKSESSSNPNNWLFKTNGLAGDAAVGLKIDKVVSAVHTILNKALIPVLKDEDTPCLYDLKNGTYYENQGSGTFSWREL